MQNKVFESQKIVRTRVKTKMVKDEQSKSLGVFPSTKNMFKEEWYFDSGCSQHVIGNNYFLTDLQPSSQDRVIFCDCGKGRVLGSGSLKITSLTKLKNLLLVEGLAINLISVVSQLCDDDLLLQFPKDKCIAYNQNHYRIMEWEKTLDNCYLLTSNNLCMHEIQLEMLVQ